MGDFDKGRKSRSRLKTEEGGRGDQPTCREWEEGGAEAGAQSPAAPPPTPLPRPHTGPGGGARLRSGALRQPPAPGGGWNRLEPAGTGDARPEANTSQRQAAAHCPRIPAPAAPLPQPGNAALGGETKGSGDLTPRRLSLVLPSLCSPLGCVETRVGSLRCRSHSLRPGRGGRARCCLGSGLARSTLVRRLTQPSLRGACRGAREQEKAQLQEEQA